MDTLPAMSGLVTDATNQEVCLQHRLWQHEHKTHVVLDQQKTNFMVFLVLWPSSPKVKLNPNHNLQKKNMTSPLQCQLRFSPIVCCPLFFPFRFRCLLLGQSFFTKKLLGGTKVTSTWRCCFFHPKGCAHQLGSHIITL